MAQAKKKMTKPADADLVLDLGDDKHLEVHGESFEFLRKSGGVVMAAVSINRAQMERAVRAATAANMLAGIRPRALLLADLQEWLDERGVEAEVNEEENSNDIFISLGGACSSFDKITAVHEKAKELFPESTVFFQ